MAWIRAVISSFLLMLFAGAPARAETILIMFEEIGCPYCEQWHDEIGIVYHNTTEGKQARLIVQDLDDPLPKGVVIGAEPYYAPTFILVDDGKEVGRIEGYPGEDFFWGLLGLILEKIPGATKNS